jgi:hypothetical protein
MTFDQLIQAVNITLRVGFFLLMCLGLLIASIMLYLDKVNGTEWVTLCGILFTADRFGSALGEFRSQRHES